MNVTYMRGDPQDVLNDVQAIPTSSDHDSGVASSLGSRAGAGHLVGACVRQVQHLAAGADPNLRRQRNARAPSRPRTVGEDGVTLPLPRTTYHGRHEAHRPRCLRLRSWSVVWSRAHLIHFWGLVTGAIRGPPSEGGPHHTKST